MKRLIPAFMVIALIAVAALMLRDVVFPPTAAPPERPPATVSVHQVQERDISYRTEALGTLRAAESVDITANVSEIVTELRFEDGGSAEAGTVLAVLEKNEERALLAEARANLAEQEREVKRLRDLVRTRSVPQSELDQRLTLLEKARHQIQAIQARIDDRTVRAPFSGQLGLRQVSPGTLISPGTVITTLDDISTMKLDFNVPATLLGSLALGQPVAATSAAFDTVFQGEITAINTRVDPVDRSIQVRARFANPERRLKPGLLMTVILTRQPRQALVVPEESLLSRQEKHYVWVVDPDSLRVSEREVSIGGRQPGWVEITDGLDGGEQVIREGLMAARPGQVVRLAEEAR